MKLSEFTNEKALDLLADLIEPATKIMTDPRVKELYESKAKMPEVVKHVIKNHKESIIEILAILDGVPVEEYTCNIFTLPKKVIELFNDKELIDFFSSAELMGEENPCGAPMENTKAKNR